MIKKSFFKTIGRIIAYILIGVLVSFLSQYIHIASVYASTMDYSLRFSSYRGQGTADEIGYGSFPSSAILNGPYIRFGSEQTTQETVVYISTNIPAGTYYLSGLIYFEQISSGIPYLSLPVITINDQVCHLYNADSVSTDAGDVKSNLSNSGFYGYTCDRVTINSSGNFLGIFGPALGRVYFWDGVSYISGSSEFGDIVQQQQETNQKLNEAIKEQEQTNKNLEDLNDNLTNSDTSDAKGDANNFFENFDDNDYGLSDVITMPLSFINKVTSSSCTPITIPMPFVDTDLTLPCISSIFRTHFSSVLSIYQTITFGMVAYWVCINIFGMVKNFKNPEKDEIEVLDL